MITAEQVKDLRPGDVVDVTNVQWPNGTTVRGPLYEAYGWLYVAERPIRNDQGQPVFSASSTLTVVSRAPRPLYVNHDRSEPVPGDVVRDEMTEDVYVREHNTAARATPFWWCPVQGRSRRDDCVNLPLRLLVDGTTGQVVP